MFFAIVVFKLTYGFVAEGLVEFDGGVIVFADF